MSDFVRRGVERTAFPIAVIFCLAMTSLIFADYYVVGKFGNDFGVYWRAANQPITEVYFWNGRFPFPYAPTMLLWVSPLSLVPMWPSYFLFAGVSLAAFVLICRRHLPGKAIALAVVSPPMVRGLLTGQVCALVAAIMIWACATPRRGPAGVAFGIIASIKPQLVLMAPLMFVLSRDWRAFRSAAATSAGIVILALLMFGADRWPEWLSSMDHFHRAVTDTAVVKIGITPAMLAERFGYSPLPFMLLGTLAGAFTVYLCRNAGPLEKAAGIALGSLMAAPYALIYDLAPVVPLLALAVVRGRILAAVGLASNIPGAPLAISAYELIRPERGRLSQVAATE